MRKSLFFLFIIALFLLTACSSKNILPEEKANEVVDTYGITMITVTIDTKEQKEALNVSFSEKKERSEAEYVNKIDNVYLHGEKAVNKLMEVFSNHEMNPDMDETELIKRISEAFEIHDFKMIRLQITFKGYDSKEIMMTK